MAEVLFFFIYFTNIRQERSTFIIQLMYLAEGPDKSPITQLYIVQPFSIYKLHLSMKKILEHLLGFLSYVKIST